MFIWEDIASAPESLRAHKCNVFVKQQNVQRKERARGDREAEGKGNSSLNDTKQGVERLAGFHLLRQTDNPQWPVCPVETLE